MLPAYNEEVALPLLFEEILKLPKELRIRVVVVDDGSSDSTASVCEEAGQRLDLILLRHERNMGLGVTMKDGFRWLSEQKEDAQEGEGEVVVVTLDADNTQPIDRIPLLLKRIDEGYDLVIASRFREGSGVSGLSTYRNMLSTIASWLLRLLFPCGARDFTCCYRAYRLSLIKKGFEHYGNDFINQQGFNSMADILIKLSLLKIRVAEVPFVLHYERKPTHSKMKIISTIIGTLTMVLRRRLGIMK